MKNVFIDGKDADDLVEQVYHSLAQANLIRLSPDQISYTEDFERLYQRIQSTGIGLTRNEVFCRLINCRKQGRIYSPNGRKAKAMSQAN